jgi:hypothetical protein
MLQTGWYSSNTLDLYSGDARFQFQYGQWYSDVLGGSSQSLKTITYLHNHNYSSPKIISEEYGLLGCNAV